MNVRLFWNAPDESDQKSYLMLENSHVKIINRKIVSIKGQLSEGQKPGHFENYWEKNLLDKNVIYQWLSRGKNIYKLSVTKIAAEYNLLIIFLNQDYTEEDE